MAAAAATAAEVCCWNHPPFIPLRTPQEYRELSVFPNSRLAPSRPKNAQVRWVTLTIRFDAPKHARSDLSNVDSRIRAIEQRRPNWKVLAQIREAVERIHPREIPLHLKSRFFRSV